MSNFKGKQTRVLVATDIAARGIDIDDSLSCDGCAQSLRARIRWVSPQAEYTPPVIYSNASRSKLVFAVEATPLEAAAALKPGQPVNVRFVKAAP